MALVRNNLACLLVSIPNPDVHHNDHNVNFTGNLCRFQLHNSCRSHHSRALGSCRWTSFYGSPRLLGARRLTASLGGCRCTLCIVPCPSSEGSPGSLSQGRDSTPDSAFPITPSATDGSISVQVVESDCSGLKGGKKWTSI